MRRMSYVGRLWGVCHNRWSRRACPCSPRPTPSASAPRFHFASVRGIPLGCSPRTKAPRTTATPLRGLLRLAIVPRKTPSAHGTGLMIQPAPSPFLRFMRGGIVGQECPWKASVWAVDGTGTWGQCHPRMGSRQRRSQGRLEGVLPAPMPLLPAAIYCPGTPRHSPLFSIRQGHTTTGARQPAVRYDVTSNSTTASFPPVHLISCPPAPSGPMGWQFIA